MTERVYSDFDGTATEEEGQKTITSPAYRGLQVQESGTSFANRKFVGNLTENVKAMLDKDENKQFRITEGMKAFYRQKLDEGAEIVFISRNRREYIEGVLQHAGFTKEEIQKMKIYDRAVVEQYGGKDGVVAMHEALPATKKAEHIQVLDDDKDDRDAMHNKVREVASHASVAVVNREKGQFYSELPGLSIQFSTIGEPSMRPERDKFVRAFVELGRNEQASILKKQTPASLDRLIASLEKYQIRGVVTYPNQIELAKVLRSRSNVSGNENEKKAQPTLDNQSKAVAGLGKDEVKRLEKLAQSKGDEKNREYGKLSTEQLTAKITEIQGSKMKEKLKGKLVEFLQKLRTDSVFADLADPSRLVRDQSKRQGSLTLGVGTPVSSDAVRQAHARNSTSPVDPAPPTETASRGRRR